MLYVNELSNINSNKVNLAKIAYILSRMEPSENRLKQCKTNYDEFVITFYQWVREQHQLKELLTAMQLVIYVNRKES